MERVFCLLALLIGYGFGLFQTAYIISTFLHKDVRHMGSGNLGSTNMYRVIGAKAGLFTFIGDILKVFLAVLVTWLIFIAVAGLDIDRVALSLYTGFGAVLGHDFPFYLRFKGGKGVAASAAAFISMGDWRITLVGFLAFVLVAALTRYVSLASMCMAVSVIVTFPLFTGLGLMKVQSGWIIDCYVIIIIMILLLILQHHANIKRLVKGRESKFSFTKKQP